jgi:hypothetical protein
MRTASLRFAGMIAKDLNRSILNFICGIDHYLLMATGPLFGDDPDSWGVLVKSFGLVLGFAKMVVMPRGRFGESEVLPFVKEDK